MVALLGIAAVLSSCGAAHHHTAALKSGQRVVTTEPVSSAGSGRFTLPAGTDLPGLGPVSGVLRPPSGEGATTYRGDRAGLYAATRQSPSCDVGNLIRMLQQNPPAAAAWASTLGIQTSRIATYLATVTPVLLRTDTRVTNYGFANGVATPIQSVLEAGTAVVVDKYGEPVAKCYCGNPLTGPVLSSRASYQGPEWSGFSARRLAVIRRSTNIITTFTLYDPSGNQMFQRKAGSHVASSGGAATSATTSSTSTTVTPTPSTTSPAQSAPPANPTTANQAPSSTGPADQPSSSSSSATQTSSSSSPATQTSSSSSSATQTSSIGQ